MAEVREIFLIVDSELAALDRKNAARSRPQIYARMSAEGKKDTSAGVTARCDSHPDDSLRKSVQEGYKAIEEMGDVMGVNQ
jgi:hypothetical protein